MIRQSLIHEYISPSKKKKIKLENKRLPEHILPNNGRLKLRKELKCKGVYLYHTHTNNTSIIVGIIKWNEYRYREYIQVQFDGRFHYVCIQLTRQEREQCKHNSQLIQLGIQNGMKGFLNIF